MTGSSKVILVCGCCVMFGFYTSSIKQAENNLVTLGEQKNYYTEARMITNAAINHAVYTLTNSGWGYSYYSSYNVNVNSQSFSGGKFSYNMKSLSSDSVLVTATAVFPDTTLCKDAATAEALSHNAQKLQQTTLLTKSSYTSYWGYWGRRHWYNWNVNQTYISPYQPPK